MKKIDLEREKEILRDIHVKMLVDHKTDVDMEMSYIAENAILLPPNGPTIIGAEAIRKALEGMVMNKVDYGTPIGPKWVEISESGDLAYDFGTYRIKTKQKEKTIIEQGNYVTLYKKIDGKWKFMCQSWNNILS